MAAVLNKTDMGLDSSPDRDAELSAGFPLAPDQSVREIRWIGHEGAGSRADVTPEFPNEVRLIHKAAQSRRVAPIGDLADNHPAGRL